MVIPIFPAAEMNHADYGWKAVVTTAQGLIAAALASGIAILAAAVLASSDAGCDAGDTSRAPREISPATREGRRVDGALRNF